MEAIKFLKNKNLTLLDHKSNNVMIEYTKENQTKYDYKIKIIDYSMMCYKNQCVDNGNQFDINDLNNEYSDLLAIFLWS